MARMAKYKHGGMKIAEQEKTFAGFVRFVAWGVAAILVTLLFLAFVNA